jgi:hypothetical protein
VDIDQGIASQCEVAVITRLERHLGAENGLVELRPETHIPKSLYIGRTLVRNRREMPVRVLNVAFRNQTLTRGFHRAHSETVMLVTPLDAVELYTQEPARSYRA